MSIIHFLNVLEGDCNIIQHDSGRVSVIDVSHAYNETDTAAEKAVKAYKESIKFSTKVPKGKIDFRQKANPDNPIIYLRDQIRQSDIFRFIITHPDMDHLDGIEDLYKELKVYNTWDTNNNKELENDGDGGRFNGDDWRFYKQIRDGHNTSTKRLTLTAGQKASYWFEDNLFILSPTVDLVRDANDSSGDYHDLSYVLLFTPPKSGGGHWKIIFAGDSHDKSWEHIIKNYAGAVSNIDVLFAPHHGRDSERDYSFLKVLKPRLTLFGNAASEHLAYSRYPKIRITNNQAGYVILDINEERIRVLVKNQEFARFYTDNRNWLPTSLDLALQAYPIFRLS